LLVPVAGRAGDNTPEDLARDRRGIQGTWKVVEYDQDGKRLPAEVLKRLRVTFQDDQMRIAPRILVQRTPPVPDGAPQPEAQVKVEDGKSDEAKYVLKRTKKAKVIELTQHPERGSPVKLKGVYSLEGDTLAIALPLPGRKQLKQVPRAPKAGLVRIILQRAIPTKKEGALRQSDSLPLGLLSLPGHLHPGANRAAPHPSCSRIPPTALSEKAIVGTGPGDAGRRAVPDGDGHQGPGSTEGRWNVRSEPRGQAAGTGRLGRLDGYQ
jgi:uncharacterized protein (TIGR03067 family)